MKTASTVLAFVFAIVAAMAVTHCPTRAATVPFSEDFATDAANWANSASSGYVDFVAAGGPDGSSYASTELVPAGRGDSSVVLFRGHDEFNSSGGAFEGNWIADGVGRFTAYVRHNAPEPLSFFTRFASPVSYPGAFALESTPVAPHTWTQISFNIAPTSSEFISFEGSDFNSVFSNIGHMQIGVDVPLSLDAVATALVIDLDQPTIVSAPEPAGAALALLGLVGCLARQRRA